MGVAHHLGVVNAVNVLQAVGFLSRVQTGGMAINHLLGYAMIALAVPAALALVSFGRAGSGWLACSGPAVYLAFVGLMVVVDYVRPIEFRSPMRGGILVPYLLLFFGAILLMGLPMFRVDRRLWLVTVATTFCSAPEVDRLPGAPRNEGDPENFASRSGGARVLGNRRRQARAASLMSASRSILS